MLPANTSVSRGNTIMSRAVTIMLSADTIMVAWTRLCPLETRSWILQTQSCPLETQTCFLRTRSCPLETQSCFLQTQSCAPGHDRVSRKHDRGFSRDARRSTYCVYPIADSRCGQCVRKRGTRRRRCVRPGIERGMLTRAPVSTPSVQSKATTMRRYGGWSDQPPKLTLHQSPPAPFRPISRSSRPPRAATDTARFRR